MLTFVIVFVAVVVAGGVGDKGEDDIEMNLPIRGLAQKLEMLTLYM